MKNSYCYQPLFHNRFLGFDNLFDSLRTFSKVERFQVNYPPTILDEGNDITVGGADAGLSEDDLKVETKKII